MSEGRQEVRKVCVEIAAIGQPDLRFDIYPDFQVLIIDPESTGLKKLITAYEKNQDGDLFSRQNSERAIRLEYKGTANGGRVPEVGDIGISQFEEDSEFRNAECIELLNRADIVVTNPPFSLFHEYVSQLVQYEKKIPTVGSPNAVTCKDILEDFILILVADIVYVPDGMVQLARVVLMPDYWLMMRHVKIGEARGSNGEDRQKPTLPLWQRQEVQELLPA